MLNRLWNAIQQKPSRLLLAASILLAGIDSVVATTSFQNVASARRLAVEVVALQDSLGQLRRVEQEGLQGLEAQAAAEESRLAELRAGFPTLGAPFDLFRRAFTLAGMNQVQLESVERGVSTVLETPVGLLATTNFRVQSSAELTACLAFIGDLESAGLTTLAVDRLNLAPGDLRCDFEVLLASAAPMAETGEAEPAGSSSPPPEE